MSSSQVKIAATSDIHGFIERLDDEICSIDPDMLVIAGDIHPCRIDLNATEWFHKVFLPFVKRIKVPVVAIPGNHDFFLSDVISNNFKDWMSQYAPRNFHLLCDSELQIDGVSVYGTPWCNYINGNWCFEASKESLKYIYSKIPYDCDVLISHTPPQIKHQYIDISMDRPEPYWRHYGSMELTKAIREKKPHIVFCGHIHSGEHKVCEVRYGDRPFEYVPCYNVSRVNEGYNIAYPVKEIVIEKED